jgi:hypothetical protein
MKKQKKTIAEKVVRKYKPRKTIQRTWVLDLSFAITAAAIIYIIGFDVILKYLSDFWVFFTG